MIISFREKLTKFAANPNKYPWNASPESKDPQKGNPEESKPLQTIVDLKMDETRKHLAPGMDHFTNWETLNQLGDDFTPSLHVKSPRERNEPPKKDN
jgi:hypothetical protein